MDSLPPLDYDDYFEQMDILLPELQGTPVWLYYETSRGCWWGEKRHCTFCGLNGFGMGFRERSADRVIDELRVLTERYPTNKIAMTDNIMPFRYHKILIPRLRDELPGLHIFYEQKANLTLDQVYGLYQAGNFVIQPGIESLSSHLLEMMRKGVKARQNIALLRYARCVGMGLKWNLLYAFPNDPVSAYEEMLDLVPKIIHLGPPNTLVHLSIDRFSPYFDTPEAYGIESLEPISGYKDVFPDGTDIGKLAYHFHGTYRGGSKESTDVMWKLYLAVKAWQEAWDPCERPEPPMLHARPNGSRGYLLYDTRTGTRVFTLNTAQTKAALVGGPMDRVPMARWAIHNRFAVDLDGWCVPLATSSYEALSRLETIKAEVKGAATALQWVG
jgi:ribosomal peptide maturation radical SAM protein 1